MALSVSDSAGVRLSSEITGYRDDMITGPNITALVAAHPWRVLNNPRDPLTFDLDSMAPRYIS
ncbi:hypothetical protein PC123_g26637 [Phytophthora cactorum]|nr:hypothetical protein PC123_g26637 [Phytophthora cactorum]